MQASFPEETPPQERVAPRGSRGSSKGYRRPNREVGSEPAGKASAGPALGFHPWESATIDLKERSSRAAERRGSRSHAERGSEATERGGAGGESSQGDPFDPQIFNRQFSSPGRPASGDRGRAGQVE
jgi:hypothetical protein